MQPNQCKSSPTIIDPGLALNRLARHHSVRCHYLQLLPSTSCMQKESEYSQSGFPKEAFQTPVNWKKRGFNERSDPISPILNQTRHCFRQRGPSSRLQTETIHRIPGTWRVFSRALHDHRLTPFFRTVFFFRVSCLIPFFGAARCPVQSILSCSGITSPPYNLHALGSNGVGTGLLDDPSGSGFLRNPRYLMVIAYIASEWCTLSLVASGWGLLRDQAISHLLDWVSPFSTDGRSKICLSHEILYEAETKGSSIVLNLAGSHFPTRGSGFSLRSNRNPLQGGAPFIGSADL